MLTLGRMSSNIKLLGFILLVHNFVLNTALITDEEYYKLPSLFHLDNYDECMLGFKKPLFCYIEFQLKPKNYQNVSGTWHIMEKLKQSRDYYHHDSLKHSICIPKACPNVPENVYQTGEDNNEDLMKYVNECYNKKYTQYDLEGRVENIFCQDAGPLQQVDGFDKLVAVLFCCLLFLIAYATWFDDGIKQKIENAKSTKEKTKWNAIYSFSIIKNFKSIAKQKTGNFLSLEGLRTVMMIQVIAYHTIGFSFTEFITNFKMLYELPREIKAFSYLYSLSSIQPFFAMSAFLSVLKFFMDIEGKVFDIKFIFKNLFRRYCRLIPTLLVMIAFDATWLTHMGKGPNWHVVNKNLRNSCRVNAWSNLLFLNNLMYQDGLCVPQSWFLAADFQCFLFINIVLALIWKLNLKPIKTLTYILISSVIFHFIYNFTNNIEMVMMVSLEKIFHFKFWDQLEVYLFHYSTAQHLSSYCMGALFGCMYYFNKERNVTSNPKILKNVFKGSVLVVLFELMVATFVYKYNFEVGRFWAALFGSFYKISYAFCAIMMLACSAKGIYFQFLSWRPLIILGNISYSTYLVHLSIVGLKYMWTRSMITINAFLQVRAAIGDVVISLVFGTLLALIVELPFLSLFNLLTKGPVSDKPNSDKDKLQ